MSYKASSRLLVCSITLARRTGGSSPNRFFILTFGQLRFNELGRCRQAVGHAKYPPRAWVRHDFIVRAPFGVGNTTASMKKHGAAKLAGKLRTSFAWPFLVADTSVFASIGNGIA